MKKNKNNKKGFTIVECVVAITVIVIIMACALSIYESTMKNTEKQWNSYLATLMADNFLAAFQASDDSENFVSKMDDLVLLYSNDKEADLPIKNKYDETDLSTVIQSMQIGTIRTNTKDNTVSLYHSNVSANAFPDESAMATLSYASSANMTSDMQVISDNNSSTGKYISVKYVNPSNSNITLVYTVTSTTVYMTATEADGTKREVSYDITDFEKKLFDMGWFLKITSESDLSSYKNGYKEHEGTIYTWDSIIFEVYDSKTGQKAVDSDGKFWYVLYIGDDQDETWYSNGSYFSVEMEIRIAKTKSESFPERTTFYSRYNIAHKGDFDDKESNSSFSFPYFLSYIVNANKQNFDIASDVQSVVVYTDYTVTSEVSYAVYNEDENTIKFIYDDGVNSNIVYTYSESDETKYAETLANVKKNLSGETAYNDSTTEKKIYIPYDVKLNKVIFDDTNYTISFYRDDVEIIRFTYSANDNSKSKYSMDKKSITVETGLYNKYYSITGDNITIISEYTENAKVLLRKEKQDANSTITKDSSYLLVLKDSNDVETTIFNSNASTTTTLQTTDKETGEWVKNINLTDIVEERYYQYTPNNGDVTLIAKVTYSHVSFDSSYEPRITIWIMPTSKVKEELEDNITNIEATNLGYDDYIYLTYRKG